MRLPGFLNFASRAIAIDLGTANTVVYLQGKGIVTNEPSVVAMEVHNGVRKVKAVGADAKLMMGKTPDYIKTIRPLRNGVIADLEVAEQMIKHFIHKAQGGRSRFSRGPEIVLCVPSGSTSVERRGHGSRGADDDAAHVAQHLVGSLGDDRRILDDQNPPAGQRVVGRIRPRFVHAHYRSQCSVRRSSITHRR